MTSPENPTPIAFATVDRGVPGGKNPDLCMDAQRRLVLAALVATVSEGVHTGIDVAQGEPGRVKPGLSTTKITP